MQREPDRPAQYSYESEFASGSPQTGDLRNGPDIHVSWRMYHTGGILWCRNEGTESAKNVRMEFYAETGWRPVLNPEIVASISRGKTAAVLDETPIQGRGRSLFHFVDSLPSKELRMTVKFEDRLGEKRERDFRVVSEIRMVPGAGGVSEREATITFYPGTLRKTMALGLMPPPMDQPEQPSSVAGAPAELNRDVSATACQVDVLESSLAGQPPEAKRPEPSDTYETTYPSIVDLRSEHLQTSGPEIGAAIPELMVGSPSQLPCQGRKRGPKPDYENASQVEGIIASAAPNGDWRLRVDAICEALDKETLCPEKWRKRDKERKDKEHKPWQIYRWSDGLRDLGRPVVVKAIEYRLKTAMRQKKNTSETLS